jgi:glycosyltransferase involved in cell wall biosynthesis
VIGFGPDAAEVAKAIARAAVTASALDDPGAAIAAAVDWTACATTETGAVEVVGWSEPGGIAPVAVDVTQLDPDETWLVGFGDTPPRVRLSERPDLVDVLRRSERQWRGVDRCLCAPGGIAVDAVVRELVAEAIVDWRRGAGTLPPDPWRDASAFREWLETPWPPWGPDIGRYWSRLWRSRPDLAAAFPKPEGEDLAALTDWATHSWRREPRSPLVRPTARAMRPQWYDESRLPGGLNLVGYFGFDKSLGNLARRILACLDSAGVPSAALDYHRSGSPPTKERVATTDRVRFDTNLIVVNPDQMALFDADYGAVVRPGRRTIGFWHWDVEYVPPHIIEATRYVDEIWTVSPFTADALRAVVGVPVRVVDIPVPEPLPAKAAPDGFGLAADRFDFLVTFDHLSVTERKNPVGAIEAYRRAFPEQRADVGLLVKSVNASHRWAEHERVRLAADARPDIRVVDSHLDRADQLALIANADCLVSLHRSEGLGLHLIEAMWLGTPTVATRYSGNLYFMDDSNSALIDATLVPVTRGEGFFPPEARWADPDLDQAADWMHRLVDDPSLGAALATAGRARMLAQATPAEAGAAIARLCQADRSRAAREGTSTWG